MTKKSDNALDRLMQLAYSILKESLGREPTAKEMAELLMATKDEIWKEAMKREH